MLGNPNQISMISSLSLENVLQKTHTEHKQVYKMGDFNIDPVKFTGNAVCNFLSKIHSNLCISLIDKPSRKTDGSISL